MPKIGVIMSITIRMRPDQNDYFKTQVNMEEIDTDKPIEEQLQDIRKGVNQIIEAGFEILGQRVTEATGIVLQRPKS